MPWLVTIFVIFAIAATEGAPNRPNIVFVMSDDQGYADVSYQCRAKPNIPESCPRTPHLDALARHPNSITFSHFYAGGPNCSPTRATVLTGRTHFRDCVYGVARCALPTATFTVAEAAQSVGYATIHVGKWHLGDFCTNCEEDARECGISTPSMHGFDDYMTTTKSAASSTTNCGCFFDGAGGRPTGCSIGGGRLSNASHPDCSKTANRCTNYWTLDRSLSKLSSGAYNGSQWSGKVTGDDTKHIMDRFEAFLEKAVRLERRPFFAMLWLHTVHVPHVAMPEFYHMYPASACDTKQFRYKGQIVHGGDKQCPVVDDCDYKGSITQMDVQIGRLVTMLGPSGYDIAQNTLVWFTSDNGPYKRQFSTGGLRACKGSLWEGGIRVPGIIHFPSMISSNQHTDAVAGTWDVLPTVMELLGAAFPKDHRWEIDGVSLVPLLKGNTAWSRSAPVYWFYSKQRAMLDFPWKYVANPSEGFCKLQKPYTEMTAGQRKGPFLFNVLDDPEERVDLSNTTNGAAVMKRMQKQLNFRIASVQNSQVCESACNVDNPNPTTRDQQAPNKCSDQTPKPAKPDDPNFGSTQTASVHDDPNSDACAARNRAVLVLKLGHSGSHMISELFQSEPSTWRFQSEPLNRFYKRAKADRNGTEALQHLRAVFDCNMQVSGSQGGFAYTKEGHPSKSATHQLEPCTNSKHWLTGVALNPFKKDFFEMGVGLENDLVRDMPSNRLERLESETSSRLVTFRSLLTVCNVSVVVYKRCNRLSQALSSMRGLPWGGHNEIRQGPMKTNPQKLMAIMKRMQAQNDAMTDLAKWLAAGRPILTVFYEDLVQGVRPTLPDNLRRFVGFTPIDSRIRSEGVHNQKRTSAGFREQISNYAEVSDILQQNGWGHALREEASVCT